MPKVQERYEVELHCGHCHRPTAHLVTSGTGALSRVMCIVCGRASAVDTLQFMEQYVDGVVRRLLAKPFDITTEFRQRPRDFITSLPGRMLSKPFRVAAELRATMDIVRPRHRAPRETAPVLPASPGELPAIAGHCRLLLSAPLTWAPEPEDILSPARDLASDAVVRASGGEDHYENGRARPSPAMQVIDANQAWAGATGHGVTVALMDTGIAEHPDLEGSVVARKDFVNDGTTLLDPSGHGTFVAGLIAAHGEGFRGVAPEAKLVSLRVLDQKGNGTMHAVLAAFDWLLRNRTEMGIKVLNLSFGAPQRSSYHRERLAGVVESAWFAGVTVVAAAGNDGPALRSIAMPGADPFVVTVGSLADQGTAALNDDRESFFSSRGPTRDGFAKPDLLAPGEHIVSLRVPGTAMDRDGANANANGAYARLSGTSASTAMAAGAAAEWSLNAIANAVSPTMIGTIALGPSSGVNPSARKPARK